MAHEASTDISGVSFLVIRAFILYLRQKKCFAAHPTTRPQARGLSGHTVNTYLRSIRIFFSWLVTEGIIPGNPFERVRIPRPPNKLIPTFSEDQVRKLLETIDASSPEGYRDYAMILMLLDTGLRVSGANRPAAALCIHGGRPGEGTGQG